MDTVVLKSGRSTPFVNHHPWLFSGAIAEVKGNPKPGEWIKVIDNKEQFIAYGLFNPHSQIRVRLYTFEEDNPPVDDFFRERIKQAIDLRLNTLRFDFLPDNACRLINSEGDNLSGLTVDRYGDYLCLQFTSLALYRYKDQICKALWELVQPKGMILRTEADILAEEGLQLQDGLLEGVEPSEPLVINENGVRFLVNLVTGQKTGFFLDQHSNRILLEQFAKNRTVLDLCTYTGGFALHAAKGAAKHITAVDVSAPALLLAHQNAVLNGFSNLDFIKADMFKFLDNCLENDKKIDLIILDPPKLTHTKGSVQNALKGYLQLNSSALKCLNPGGILFTCSCSGRISREDFLFMLHKAAINADKVLRILEIRGAERDHPILSSCPETEYLKCVIGCVQ